MTQRSQEDWRQLVAEQQSSGLTAAAFCRDRNINEKYFSLRKKKLKLPSKEVPAFVRASIKAISPTGPSLHVNGTELRLGDASPTWVARLLRELG